MKKQKIISAIIVMFILFYFIFSLIPVGITRSFAADMAAGTLSSDINSIDDSLYPGYKNLINDLKAKRTGDTFLVYYTGIDWNQAINAEYQGHWHSPINLVQIGSNYTGMWLCPLCGTKDYDNGTWCCASKEAIEYMMDPRNSINESDLFQFKTIDSTDVSLADIQTAVSGYGSFINNSEAIQAIYDASQEYKVNAYFIISKIINEHGSKGTTLSNGTDYTIDGVTKKVYNYFNINSSGNGVDIIINNGLKVAFVNDWTSIRASIKGGVAIVKQSYIDAYGQNTLYYQKFNVSKNIDSVGSHQYQQNLLAAQKQGTSLKNQYSGKTTTHTFIIPLYKNMPQTACPRPDTSKANSITYKDAVLQHISSSLYVRVAPDKNSSDVGSLDPDEKVKVINRAASKGAGGYYWDLIVSEKLGIYGYAARNLGGDECIVLTGSTGSNQGATNDYSNKFVVNDGKIKALPDVTYDMVKTYWKSAVVKDINGNTVTSGNIGTGYTATIDGGNYTFIKKGDINGDCGVNISDAILILNHLNGTKIINGIEIEAAKIGNQANVSIADVILLLNSMVGKHDIGF